MSSIGNCKIKPFIPEDIFLLKVKKDLEESSKNKFKNFIRALINKIRNLFK